MIHTHSPSILWLFPPYSLLQRSSLFSFFLLLYCCSQAQAPKNSFMIWGQVPQEQLSMTHCPYDSQASAVVLGDFGEWNVKSADKALGYKAVLERHTRIKILNEGGFDWAEGVLSYISIDKFEKLSGFKGQTLNWDGSTLQAIPLNKENVIEEAANEFVTQLNYSFPQIKAGSIIELTYTLTTSDFLHLKPWYFQVEIPTLRSEVRVNEPKKIDHLVVSFNTTEAERVKGRWIQENLPALREEPYVNNLENYRSRLQFELKDYARNFRSSYGATFLTADLYQDWNDLVRDFVPQQYMIGGQDMTDRLQALVDSLTAEVPDTLEQLKLVYNFVRDSMEWNGEYAAKAKDIMAPVYLSAGKGNSAEINILLMKMLSMARIRCVGLILGTVDHGLPVNYPIRSQFNHYIVVAEIGEQRLFLDAINPMRPYTHPGMNDLNTAGFALIKGGGGGWIDIPNTYRSAQQTAVILKINDDGSLRGNVSQQYTGYFASDLRELLELVSDEEEFWEEFKDESLVDTEILNSEIQDADAPDVPLVMKYDLYSSEFSQLAGDFLYLNPFLNLVESENPFQGKERSYFIDMGCLLTQNMMIYINIPEGFEVESLPTSKRIALPGREMTYTYSCAQQGRQIQIMSGFQTEEASFPPEAYPALKQVFDLMVAKQQEQIVLKKAP